VGGTAAGRRRLGEQSIVEVSKQMATDLEQRVSAIIVEQLGATREEIVPEASFTDDLGVDSLTMVELVMAMEETFDIEIPDEDAEKIQTIGDAISYVKEKLEA
jgi:acyl carrier protein